MATGPPALIALQEKAYRRRRKAHSHNPPALAQQTAGGAAVKSDVVFCASLLFVNDALVAPAYTV